MVKVRIYFVVPGTETLNPHAVLKNALMPKVVPERTYLRYIYPRDVEIVVSRRDLEKAGYYVEETRQGSRIVKYKTEEQARGLVL